MTGANDQPLPAQLRCPPAALLLAISRWLAARTDGAVRTGLDYVEAAVRKVAQLEVADHQELQQIRAENNRLEVENSQLRHRVAELEGRRGWGLLVRQGEPFGTPVR